MTEYQKKLLVKAAAMSKAYRRLEAAFAEASIPQLGQALTDLMNNIETHGTVPVAVEWDATWLFVKPKALRHRVSKAVARYFDARKAFYAYIEQAPDKFENAPVHSHEYTFRGMGAVVEMCDTGHTRVEHDGEVVSAFAEAFYFCPCGAQLCIECHESLQSDAERTAVREAPARTPVASGAGQMRPGEIPWPGRKQEG